MAKQYDIPGYGPLMRAGDMPLPDTRTLGDRVHAFMDANPQLGQNPSGGLPNRQMNRLFQQLMQDHYGKRFEEYPDYDTMYDLAEDPNTNALLGMLGSEQPLIMDQMGNFSGDDGPEISALADAMNEPWYNFAAGANSNFRYDRNQPYGFDFRSLIDGASDFDGKYSRPGAMEAVSGDGEIIPAPENPQLPSVMDDDPLKGTVAQLLRTGGSMALPMLFSMLMRGGK